MKELARWTGSWHVSLPTNAGSLGPEGVERVVGGGGVDGVEVGTEQARHGIHQARPLTINTGKRELLET